MKSPSIEHLDVRLSLAFAGIVCNSSCANLVFNILRRGDVLPWSTVIAIRSQDMYTSLLNMGAIPRCINLADAVSFLSVGRTWHVNVIHDIIPATVSLPCVIAGPYISNSQTLVLHLKRNDTTGRLLAFGMYLLRMERIRYKMPKTTVEIEGCVREMMGSVVDGSYRGIIKEYHPCMGYLMLEEDTLFGSKQMFWDTVMYAVMQCQSKIGPWIVEKQPSIDPDCVWLKSRFRHVYPMDYKLLLDAIVTFPVLQPLLGHCCILGSIDRHAVYQCSYEAACVHCVDVYMRHTNNVEDVEILLVELFQCGDENTTDIVFEYICKRFQDQLVPAKWVAHVATPQQVVLCTQYKIRFKFRLSLAHKVTVWESMMLDTLCDIKCSSFEDIVPDACRHHGMVLLFQ